MHLNSLALLLTELGAPADDPGAEQGQAEPGAAGVEAAAAVWAAAAAAAEDGKGAGPDLQQLLEQLREQLGALCPHYQLFVTCTRITRYGLVSDGWRGHAVSCSIMQHHPDAWQPSWPQQQQLPPPQQQHCFPAFAALCSVCVGT